MLVANFMRFRRKRLEKQTHTDNFPLKKNPKRIYLASLYLLMSWYSIKIVEKQEKPKIIIKLLNKLNISPVVLFMMFWIFLVFLEALLFS